MMEDKEFLIYVEDVMNFLKNYNGPKFHFALSDPPYEISHLGGWDNSGIAYSQDLYKGLLNVLHPGAFIVFYGYSRTHHRAMVAMEDAGFILHKSVFAWVYTSGNPLGAPNMQRNIDKFFAQRFGGVCECDEPIVRITEHVYLNMRFKQNPFPVSICDHCGRPIRNVIDEIQWGATGGMKLLGGHGYGNNQKQIIAESMTPEAEAFKDYTYGLAWSKPMLEPIIIAQKPFDTDNQIEGILENGTGVVNVHKARYTDRWPGNFIAVHDAGCTYDKSSDSWNCVCGLDVYANADKDFNQKIPTFGYDIPDVMLASVDQLLYDKKPSKKERHSGIKNIHPSVKPISVNRYLSELFLPPEEYAPRMALNLFSGSGSEAIGLLHGGWDSVICIERDQKYANISLDRITYFVNPNIPFHFVSLENDDGSF